MAAPSTDHQVFFATADPLVTPFSGLRLTPLTLKKDGSGHTETQKRQRPVKCRRMVEAGARRSEQRTFRSSSCWVSARVRVQPPWLLKTRADSSRHRLWANQACADAERSELSGCNATQHPRIIMDSLRRAVASYGLRGRGCLGVGLRLGMHRKVHVSADQAPIANVCSCRARRREHVDL